MPHPRPPTPRKKAYLLYLSTREDQLLRETADHTGMPIADVIRHSLHNLWDRQRLPMKLEPQEP